MLLMNPCYVFKQMVRRHPDVTVSDSHAIGDRYFLYNSEGQRAYKGNTPGWLQRWTPKLTFDH